MLLQAMQISEIEGQFLTGWREALVNECLARKIAVGAGKGRFTQSRQVGEILARFIFCGRLDREFVQA